MINVSIPDWELVQTESYNTLKEGKNGMRLIPPHLEELSAIIYDAYRNNTEEVDLSIHCLWEFDFIAKVFLYTTNYETPYNYLMKRVDDSLYINLTCDIGDRQEFSLDDFKIFLKNSYYIHYYNKCSIASTRIIKEYYNYVNKV